jgi:hypothetical protein
MGPKPGARNSDSSRYSMTWRELSLFFGSRLRPDAKGFEVGICMVIGEVMRRDFT